MSWIKVEDRLPEDCVVVLLCLVYGSGKKYARTGFYDHQAECWMYNANVVLVTHWQPLPELPDESS